MRIVAIAKRENRGRALRGAPSADVAALDRTDDPLVETMWRTAGEASIYGTLAPNQVIEIAINFDRGWSAEANGRIARVQPDGLGFLAIEPQCSGACEVRLHWKPGWSLAWRCSRC